MGVKSRLINFLAYKGISQRVFEINCGLSNGFVDKVGEGTRASSLDKISAVYPELNQMWLRTGYGEMLIAPDVLNKVGKIQAACVDEIKACDDNERMLQGVSFVPLLPVSAQGGTLNDFVLSVKDCDCEKIISPIKGADFAITIAGDSMSPRLPSGAQILIKKINEKAFIDWGKIYVLDTCNGVVVKRILPGRDADKVKCESINPAYPPFEVNFEDVFGMYRVVLCMSIE